MSTRIENRNNQYFLIDNDQETAITTIKMTSDGYLHIPENSSGRKLVNRAKVDSLGSYELKPIVKDGTHSAPVSKKSLLEYMTPEDKELYDAIMERAKKAHEEATKKEPLTPEQKLRKKLEKLQAQLEALTNEEAQG